MLFRLLFTIKLLKECHIVVKVVWFIKDCKKKGMELMRKPFSQRSQLGVIVILSVGSKAKKLCKISTKISVGLFEIMHLPLNSDFWFWIANGLSKVCCKSFNT